MGFGVTRALRGQGSQNKDRRKVSRDENKSDSKDEPDEKKLPSVKDGRLLKRERKVVVLVV